MRAPAPNVVALCKHLDVEYGPWLDARSHSLGYASASKVAGTTSREGSPFDQLVGAGE